LQKTRLAPAVLPQSAQLAWALNVGLSLFCALIMFFNRFALHLPYPYNFPFIPFQHWQDFRCFEPRFQHFHQLDVFSDAPQLGPRFAYPAPAAVLYKAFYLFGHYGLAVFFLFNSALIVYLAVLLGRRMVSLGISTRVTALFLASTILCSYPLWFDYLIGNIEVCIFLLVAFGILAFLRERFYLCAILIGIAVSLKLFPMVYFALFISRKKYRACALGILTAIVTNIVSLWLVCPSLSVASAGIQKGLDGIRNIFMLRFMPEETAFDHSIFGLIKALGRHHYNGIMPSGLLTAYMACVALGGLALYFLVIRRLPLLNQIVALSVASILLPPLSHDYTLIHLYPAYGLLVLFAIKARNNNLHVRGLLPAFVCLGILFSAQSQIIIHNLGRSGQIKTLVLIALLIISLRNRWPTPEEHADRLWAPADSNVSSDRYVFS